MDTARLQKLYLDDLTRMVRKGTVMRPRVRNPKKWKNLRTILAEDVEDAKVITPEDFDRTWVWSDLHFSHKNIIKYSNRPFGDVQHMNESLIRNFNSVVGPDDISIWVGDVTFGSDQQANQLLSKCPGYKILIVGNHDFDKKQLKDLYFDEIHLMYFSEHDETSLVFTHYPMGNLPRKHINVHGHLHVGHAHLYGPPTHLNVNCEFHNYTPISLTEVFKIVKEFS